MASCHGTLDVVVHLHSFRNVDLFSRGIYMIRLSTTTKASKHVGIPYSYYSKPSTLSTFVRAQEIPCAHAKSLPVAQIVNETSEFSTRAFVIKYRDERLELNEGVQFQLLVESKLVQDGEGPPRLVFENDAPLLVKLELLMAELEKPQSSAAAAAASAATQGSFVAAEKPSSTPTFSRIASQTLAVVCDPRSLQLHAYFPVTFTAMHFCQLDVTVHTCLINLKFRKRAYSRGLSLSGGMADQAKRGLLSSTSSLSLSSASASSASAAPETFEELLFGASAQTITGAKAEAMSRVHLQPMLQSLGATAAALRNVVGALNSNNNIHNSTTTTPPQTDILADQSPGGDDSTNDAVASVVALLQQRGDGASTSSYSVGLNGQEDLAAAAAVDFSDNGDDASVHSAALHRVASSPSAAANGSRSQETPTPTPTPTRRGRSSPDYLGSPASDAGAAAAAAASTDNKSRTPQEVATAIEKDIKLVARRLFLLWGRFVAMLPHERLKKASSSTSLDHLSLREPTTPNTTPGSNVAAAAAAAAAALLLHPNAPSPSSVVTRLQRTWLLNQRRWWAARQATRVVRVQKILQPADPADLDATFRALRSTHEEPKAALDVYDEALLKDPSMLPVCASHVYLRRDDETPAPSSGEGATGPQQQQQQPPPPPPPVDDKRVIPGIPDFDGEAAASYEGPHLIVMQHGWYASSFDMRLLRAYAILLFPDATVLSPQSNEDNSGGSMGPMGQRLAHEVVNFIKHRCDELCDPDPKIGRISFVGHSAGSMIIRTALTTAIFKPFLPKLHAFVSLSSSHCGNMFVPSSIIAGGMWALQHLHQSKFMDELQLIDQPADIREAFMYKLSQQRGFEHFRFVVLVASQQDAYVPLHTAHATIPRPAENDSNRDGGAAYMQMATNLMAPISQKTADAPKQTTVVRLTMDYKFPQTNLDTVIGRAAHLAYIDSSSAVLLILFSLYNLLK